MIFPTSLRLAVLVLLLQQTVPCRAYHLPSPPPPAGLPGRVGSNGRRLFSVAGGCVDPRDFGAVADTAVSPVQPHWQTNTRAVQQALASASSGAGTGIVCVRGGAYTVADLQAMSNAVLDLDTGSGLLTSVTNCTRGLLLIENVNNFTVQVR